MFHRFGGFYMKVPRVGDKAQTYLLLLFVFLALGITAGGYFHYLQHREYVLGQKSNEILAVANLKLGQILGYREERLGDAETILSNPLVVRPMREWLRNPKEGKHKEEILGYLESVRRDEPFDGVFLIDETGKTRLSLTYGEAEASSLDQALVRQAMEERCVIVKDLYQDERRGLIFWDIYVPLVGEGPDGLPLGVLLLRSDPNQSLYPLLRSWPAPSLTAETFLVRREGEEVVFLNELRHQRATALSLRLPLSRRDNPAAMAIAGMEGIVQGVDYRGALVLAAIRAVPNSPWYLVAKVDMDEVTYPIRQQGYTILVAAILLIFVLGLTVLLLWRHQTARLYKRMYEDEVKIQALTRHLALMTRYANDIILLYNDEFRIVEANERATLAYGYSREELLQRTARDLRPPETWAVIDEQIRQIRERKSLIFETIHQRKDGSTFPVEVSVRGLEVEGKQYFQSIIRDITERKEGEERLKRSEQQFRDLFDHAPVGYHEFDVEGRITRVNRTELEMLGYELEEMIGQPVWVFNAQGEMVRDRILAKLSGKLPPERGFERTLRRKDGTMIHVLIEDRLLRDEKGKITGIRACIQDITERKKAEVEREKLIEELSKALSELKEKEEALRKSEERFRDLFDHAPIGYHEYDLEGRITNVNQTDLEMLGYTREEMIGQYIWKFNVGEEIAREQVLAKLAGKLPPGKELERIYRRKDGTTFPVLVEDRLIRDEEGRIKGIRCIIQDITERKRAEGEREKLIAELREALAKVKTLRGLIPICASCKKIRDDQGYWKQIESYVRDHSEAEFSHGICPDCMKKLYPDFVDDGEGREDEIRRP